MKIHKIKIDHKNAQWLISEVSEDLDTLELKTFDCLEKKNDWNIEMNWYVDNPKKKEGNFYYVTSGALAFDEKVYNSELYTLFEMAGEILPIKLETGKQLYVLNVLECVNAFNSKLAEYAYYPDGTKGRILKYAFHKNRLSESSIFKIPETSKAEILTYEGLKDSDDEFKPLYEKLGFTGLQFEELASI